MTLTLKQTIERMLDRSDIIVLVMVRKISRRRAKLVNYVQKCAIYKYEDYAFRTFANGEPISYKESFLKIKNFLLEKESYAQVVFPDGTVKTVRYYCFDPVMNPELKALRDAATEEPVPDAGQ